MSERHCLVLCTCPEDGSAERIAEALVDEHLAACVNIVKGLTSIFHWQGRRETASECLLLIKTRKACYPSLEARIRELHPYEVPEIIALSLEAGLKAYLDWMDAETRPPA